MKHSPTTAGVLALALGSAFTAAVPACAPPQQAGFVVDVHRDQAAFRQAIERQTNSSLVDRTYVVTPDGLNYAGYWFADVTAGGQHVQALLDTGSADFWLISPNSPSDATQGQETWDPTTASQTTLMSGYSFDIGYGQGGNGVKGPVYKSYVCLGAACTNMAVGSATYDQGLGNFPRSGIMGLAFKGGNSISPVKQNTFMEQLAETTPLDKPIFVTKFSAESYASQIAFGYNPFGGVPPFQSIQVESSGNNRYSYSWSYSGVQYFKNGKSLGTFDVVFDTGGPMTSASESIVRGYYNGIPGARDVNGDASSWTVPCGTRLPDLTMHLGSALLIIPGQKFYNGNTATSGQCTVWLVKENSATRGVIGDPFFNEHVVIWNSETGQLQWANQS